MRGQGVGDEFLAGGRKLLPGDSRHQPVTGGVPRLGVRRDEQDQQD